MNKNTWMIIISVLVVGCVLSSMLACFVIGGLGSGLALASMKELLKNDDQALALGSQAPDFNLPTLEGEQVQLSDFRGSPVVLSFGATWCYPCREEAPRLEDLHQTYKGELIVLHVSLEDSREDLYELIDEKDLTYTFALDSNGRVGEIYRVYSIPSLFFIDAQGVIREHYIGLHDEEALLAGLEKIGLDP